jgi:hypothetical protein
MDWTDGNKSRVSDFFRRIDKSGTGKVPREDLIDGILASSQSISLFHSLIQPFPYLSFFTSGWPYIRKYR